MKRSYYPTLKPVAAARLVCYVVLFFTCFALAYDPEGYWWPRLFGLSAFTALLFAFGDRKAVAGSSESEWLTDRQHRLIFLGIIILGVFLRLYRLNTIPYGVWFDEAQNTLVTQQILNVPGYWPIFIPDFTQLPAFAFYLYSPFVALFPERVYGIRFIAACFGIGAIAVTYLVARELFNKTIALVAAFFIAFSRWHITFSRFGMCQVLSTFFFPLVIYFYLRAARTKKMLPAAICGLVLGLTLQTYYITIVLIPLLALAFLWALLNGNRNNRPSWRQMMLIGAATLLTYSPMLYFAYFEWNAFSERFRTVSDVSPIHVIDVVQGLIRGEMNENGDKAYQAIRAHLLMFNVSGDRNGRHNLPREPMLDPLAGAFFVIGLCATVIGMRRGQNATLLLWLFGVLSGGIFSLGFEAPQAGRTIPLTPLVAILAAHGFSIAARPFLPSKRTLTTTCIACLMLFSVFWNLLIGFKQIVNPLSWGAYSTLETKISEILVENGESKPVLVPETLANLPTEQLLAKGLKTDVFQSAAELIVPKGVEGATVVLSEPSYEHLEYLKKMYPRARVEDFLSPPSPFEWSVIAAKIVNIPKADVDALYVPKISCRDDTELVAESLGQIEWKQFRERYRCLPIWRAGINNDVRAFFTIRIEGDESVSLFIDHERVVEKVSRHSATLMLPGGFHLIELVSEGAAAGASSISVTRSTDRGLTAPQPVSLYSPAIFDGGLTGYYYHGSEFGGDAQIVRNDPNLHIYFHYLPLDLPFSIRWKGFLRVPEDGSYQFIVSSIDSSKVFIDGKMIIDQLVPGQGIPQDVVLTAGSVPIMVEYTAKTGYSQIMLQWKRPGQNDPMPIPAKYFAPESVLVPRPISFFISP